MKSAAVSAAAAAFALVCAAGCGSSSNRVPVSSATPSPSPRPSSTPTPTPTPQPTPTPSGIGLPDGFTRTVVAAGLGRPSAMEVAPDGRVFVCDQDGNLRVIRDGSLNAAPFATLAVDASGERGLLGVAFDPAFAVNGFVYVYATVTDPVTHNRVIRFTARGDVAAPGSATTIFDLDPLSGATNHNGGAIHFGPDNKLYIGVGDNAHGANSPSLETVLGKVLRIGADGTIPADNPFFAAATGNNRAIWARGLRNPFTFAFQPGTGRLFIDDVGENTWEEIDEGIAGSDYGWPSTEGPTGAPGIRAPLYAYPHLGIGTGPVHGVAITGGAFYNPDVASFGPGYVGKYFFADIGAGWIKVLDPATGTVTDFASPAELPVDLKVDPADGSLYYLARATGTLYRIAATRRRPGHQGGGAGIAAP